MSNPSIDDLRAALPQLAERDRNFASSLIEQHGRRGSLSPKQWYWVGELSQRATAPARPAVKVGLNLDALAPFFARAPHLKRPGVTLGEVNVSKAPEGGRNAGHLYVKFRGNYVGKVNPEGEFRPDRRVISYPLRYAGWERTPAVLAEFAGDPVRVAQDYGRRTGICCFCAKPLTDERSTAVGYGATCAKNYQLPWGADAQAPTANAA